MTTNNHPAHGPVSLERLHHIREILSKAAAQSDGGNLCYAMADAVKVIDEVLNAEPVAYMTYKGYLLHAADPKLAEYSDPTPLYDMPQAPVVPDAISTRQAISKMEECEPCDSVNVAFKYGWNACRAAMLQAGNSPVTQDGWIPVSERTPEEGQEIIVMDVTRGKVQSGMIYQNGRFVDFNEEYYEVKSPSHWMPLPEAPKQE
ncbi:putative phage protein [Escherichia coli]|uniref:DUF551 domain-containing protein n=1 Tax=Escherichia coli TaxID=562 RepID=UPI000BE4C077|nr:DUF551 domain-containing protein [Escherichia coli]GDR02026.1 putative phage protein [Escherichia coli]